MFTHILLASDGSAHAQGAAVTAAVLAKKFNARLTIVNVYHPTSPFEPFHKSPGPDELKTIEKRQNEILQDAGRIADDMRVACQAIREIGRPVEKIVQAAANAQADLIVLGSRGLGDIKSLLLGSVSDGVMQRAHCPVLIVKSSEKVASAFHNILLGSDGSDCAIRAANVAASLAKEFDSRLTIINIFQMPIATDPYGTLAAWSLDQATIDACQENAIASAGRIADNCGVTYQRRKEIGNPTADMTRIAEEESCDLIVLGSRGLSGAGALLLGSVSDRVAHLAHCPVLIVK